MISDGRWTVPQISLLPPLPGAAAGAEQWRDMVGNGGLQLLRFHDFQVSVQFSGDPLL